MLVPFFFFDNEQKKKLEKFKSWDTLNLLSCAGSSTYAIRILKTFENGLEQL